MIQNSFIGPNRLIIYGLHDPRPDRLGELRYIGKSSSGLRRPRQHLYPSSIQDTDTPLARWLSKLNKLGLKPTIEVLRVCVEESLLNTMEIECIAEAKKLGCRLLNITDGGGGLYGYHHSDETKAKLSKANTGVVPSEQTKLRQSIAAKNRDPAILAHFIETSIARRREPEVRERMAAAQRGKTHTEEHRAKNSAANKGREKSVEERQNIKDGQRRRRGLEAELKNDTNNKEAQQYFETRREHNSAAQKKRFAEKPMSQETRAKLSKKGKGRVPTEAARANMKAAATLREAKKREAKLQKDS